MNAKTRFLVQWLEDTNLIIGTTSVLVYPTNLFQMLPSLRQNDFGVLDPDARLKPLLKAAEIPFVDLGEMALTNFSGKLAIIGPFDSKDREPDGIANRISAIAKDDVAVVWIQPPQDENDKLQPSFYSVWKGRAPVVVAQAKLVSDLAENPQSQLNLICLCQEALNPQPALLPGSEPQPWN